MGDIKYITIKGAKEHNLKNIDVKIRAEASYGIICNVSFILYKSNNKYNDHTCL